MTISQPNPPVAPTGGEGTEFIDLPENTPQSAPPARPPEPRARRATRELADRDRLDGVAAALRRAAGTAGLAGGRGGVLRGEWLGHALHPALTDIPLGCWMSATALDFLGGPAARGAARRLVGVGLLAAPFTALSGLADWSAAVTDRSARSEDDNTGDANDADDREIRRVGAAHGLGNVLVMLVYLGSWQARRAAHHRVGVGLGVLGGMLAIGTGYLGGHMALRPELGGADPGFPGTAAPGPPSG